MSILGIGGSLSAQEETAKEPRSPNVGIIDLKNEVEGTATISRLAREGIWVTKDQVVAALDGSALRDQRTNQRIVVQRAMVDSEQAEKALQAAELALKEYVELGYPTTLKGLQMDLDFTEIEANSLSVAVSLGSVKWV